jgi:hypothetical protein
MKRFLLFTQIMVFSGNLIIMAETLNDSVPPGKNYDKAAFRLWYLDDHKTLRGIIVLMPGSNGDGRGLADEPFWQNLAQKHDFALVGCYFTDHQHENMEIENYANVKEGSGQALLDVISLFAKSSGHSELADAPIILWGHSAGGEFNYEFVCWKPERVLAFVVNKGGFYFSALAPKHAREVPGIFFTAENDLESRKDIVKGIFLMNRRVGALWAFAEEPGAGHEIGQTQKLAGIFFDEVIPLRLHKKSSDADSSVELQTIPVNSGYVGDIKAPSYSPVAEGRKSDFPAAWLPGSKFAEAWLLFIKNKPF